MIVIALADGNPTYCQGLKTMLEQVELNSSHYGLEVLYKGSGKKEFEPRIRKLAFANNKTNRI